ncbi:hypothetical protein STEG23_029928, partial [Scotinomys teguina]
MPIQTTISSKILITIDDESILTKIGLHESGQVPGSFGDSPVSGSVHCNLHQATETARKTKLLNISEEERLPGVLAAGLAKTSSSLTILQKKVLQNLGPLRFFLKPELALNGPGERSKEASSNPLELR